MAVQVGPDAPSCCALTRVARLSVPSKLSARRPELKLRYVIWQKQIWQQGIGWRAYTRYDPYGNLQQNHYDHVHVTVYGSSGTA